MLLYISSLELLIYTYTLFQSKFFLFFNIDMVAAPQESENLIQKPNHKP